MSDIPSIPDIPDVIDNLTSGSTTDALSANQGRILNESVESLSRPNYTLLGTYSTSGSAYDIPFSDTYSSLMIVSNTYTYPLCIKLLNSSETISFDWRQLSVSTDGVSMSTIEDTIMLYQGSDQYHALPHIRFDRIEFGGTAAVLATIMTIAVKGHNSSYWICPNTFLIESAITTIRVGTYDSYYGRTPPSSAYVA